jgi:phosphoenolpyruvate carboxykinase (ATP)
MVRPPAYYAELLAEKIREHHSHCWLVNTGWTGGPYGTGHRMPIQHTRALLNAALDGSLADVEYEEDPVFGLQVPTSCPGVPAEVLRPRDTWSDPSAYDAKARHLATLFHANFEQVADSSSDEIKNAGPKKV